MKNTRAKIIKIITAISLAVLPVAVSAYTFLEPLPGLGREVNGDLLATYITWLFRFALAAAAFLAVMQIVIGAMHIIVGGASESSQTKGRGMIEMALWGLLLAVSSVLILETINPDLIRTGLTIPNIEVKDVVSGDGDGTPYVPPPTSTKCESMYTDNGVILRACYSTCPNGRVDVGQLDCGSIKTCCEVSGVPTP
ncbi:MAG: hypothetical protein GXP44_01340 [bacterium]|nr:hypothetical protein [bacterium]